MRTDSNSGCPGVIHSSVASLLQKLLAKGNPTVLTTEASKSLFLLVADL
ncbi:MAG: hypothetical protein WKF77_01750 [Planctomycetaceae bacterium]